MSAGIKDNHQRIPLGQFELIKPIGKGGMATVWKGTHSTHKVPVAVKFIADKRAQSQDAKERFLTEVQAVAKLNHPGIVTVYDYGEVPPETETASNGAIQRGSPYLVMELVPGGTLSKYSKKPIPWPVLKTLLIPILDALAHAHAREVVHRDLKMGNILICDRSGLIGRPILTDFGVAHILSTGTKTMGDAITQSSKEPVAGTFQYMAPEQFTGKWRDYGPWTDLYALGCLIYRLLSGKRLFPGKGFAQLANAHINLQPSMSLDHLSLPPGLEDWLNILLKKPWNKRFSSAAEALEALKAIKDTAPMNQYKSGSLLSPRTDRREDHAPLHQPTPHSPISLVSLDTAVMSKPKRHITTQLLPLEPETLTFSPPEPGQEISRDLPPWKRQESLEITAPMRGTGLGLYGLREIPLVGRNAERDAIWKAMQEVYNTGLSQLVVLRGTSGVGKSRTAQWMSERALELGVARILKAIHSPTGGLGEGISRMVSRYFRCIGLPFSEAYQRIAKQLKWIGISDPFDHRIISEMASQQSDGLTSTLDSAISEDRGTKYATLSRFIQRMGEDRPVLMWLDDAQWSMNTLEFCRHLLQVRTLNPAPCLMLLTVQEEALSTQPGAKALVEEISSMPAVTTVPIMPLPALDHKKLVRGLLGLDPELAQAVEERTGGNPLFAVQLVGDWVSRGTLELSNNGFSLKENASAYIPDNLHEVWESRLVRLICHSQIEWYAADGTVLSHDMVFAALELASVLGQHVNAEEWRRTCAVCSLSWPANLSSHLIGHALARRNEEGWSFVHGMLPESLKRRAEEKGRLKAYHHACSEYLSQFSLEDIEVTRRLAYHRVAAGDLNEAVEPLSIAAKHLVVSGLDLDEGLELLEKHADILKQLNIPESDPRWGEQWLIRCNLLKWRYSLEAIAPLANRLEQFQDVPSWTHLKGDILHLRGVIFSYQGERVRAYELLTRAYAICLSTEKVITATILGALRGVELLQLGRIVEAKPVLLEALALGQKHGLDTPLIDVKIGLSRLHFMAGKYEAAEIEAKEALDLSERTGSLVQKGIILNLLGEIARMDGNLSSATAYYQQAMIIFKANRSGMANIMMINLGITLIAQERYKEALGLLNNGHEQLLLKGPSMYLPFTHSLLLSCCARTGDFATYDAHFSALKALESKSAPETDPDIAYGLQLAGEITLSLGDHTRAKQALQMALLQWQRLDRKPEIKQVTALINSF